MKNGSMSPGKWQRSAWIIVSLAVGLAASGCSFGPAALRATNVEYNKAIRQTTDEQLLLNLVRLRYREYPLFLELVSLSTQFNFGASGSIAGTINENVGGTNKPNVLGLGGGISFQDRPTITFTPLRGEDFVQRMMSPFDVETIISLYYSGWSIERVLRLMVQKINRLENAMSAAGPTPSSAPEYEKFLELTRALRELQSRGLISVGQVARSLALSPDAKVQFITAEELVAAAERGYTFSATENGEGLVLSRSLKVALMNIDPAAWQSLESFDTANRVHELLFGNPLEKNVPRRITLELLRQVDSSIIAKEPSEIKNAPALPDGPEKVSILPRSLLGAMFYLSQAVDVPTEHRDKGLVTITTAESGEFVWTDVTDGLFHVQSSRGRPDSAAIAVHYRGHWFYIDDADLDSKSTFGLLSQLMNLKAGNSQSSAPVLTLDVGN